MQFPGFYGNAPAKAQVSRLVDGGRLPQALLIEGDRGTGKHTFARLIAQAAVCRAGSGELPCGVCAACRKAMADGHPDIITVEGGENARSFGVDKIRALREDANILPNEAENKIYLLLRAHNMTEQAQNALLKILEEPPARVRFILTAESARQMLPTILSRCATVSLLGVSEAEACRAVSAMVPDAAPIELHQAAHLWNGNIGRMAETLRGGSLTRASELAEALVQSLFGPDETAVLLASVPLLRDRDLFRSVFGMLSMRLSDALRGEDRALCGSFSAAQLMACSECIRACLTAADRYMNQSLLVTYAAAQLRAIMRPVT